MVGTVDFYMLKQIKLFLYRYLKFSKKINILSLRHTNHRLQIDRAKPFLNERR